MPSKRYKHTIGRNTKHEICLNIFESLRLYFSPSTTTIYPASHPATHFFPLLRFHRPRTHTHMLNVYIVAYSTNDSLTANKPFIGSNKRKVPARAKARTHAHSLIRTRNIFTLKSIKKHVGLLTTVNRIVADENKADIASEIRIPIGSNRNDLSQINTQ